MKTRLVVSVIAVSISLVSNAYAGHCRKGVTSDRLKCLNSEVSYLTQLYKRQAEDILVLRRSVEQMSLLLPVGAILPWNSSASEAPKGWQFCSGFDGRWLVGTDSAEKVGKPTDESTLTLTGKTEEVSEGQRISWGEEDDRTPHATGFNHKHEIGVTIKSTDIVPPSIHVRYICRMP